MDQEGHRLCSKIQPPTKRTYECSEKVEQLLRMASELTADEKMRGLCCGLLSRSGMTSADLNGVKNYATALAKKLKAREQQCPVVSSAPLQPQRLSHHKVSLIVQADLIPEGAPLAFDCEKLLIHEVDEDGNKTKSMQSAAGDFSLVDMQGRIVMWCYVYRKNVCVYNTANTGLDAEKIRNGISQETFQEILDAILKKNILVGAAVKEDFKHLGLEINSLPGSASYFDIQDFFRDQNGEKVSLAVLAEHFTGQPFQESTHSSLADSRMTALAYKRYLRFKEAGLQNFSCPDFDDFREASKAKKKSGAFRKRWEKCKCFQTKPALASREEWKNPKTLPGI